MVVPRWGGYYTEFKNHCDAIILFYFSRRQLKLNKLINWIYMCVATATATAENSLMMILRNTLIFVFVFVHYGAVVSNFSQHRYHHQHCCYYYYSGGIGGGGSIHG
tara:strand:- start:750 stop:1067 length:318 start_codon:yes stop_codon:yes gene_type:complete